MTTLYTALGRYEIRKTKNGRHPVVVLHRREHCLSIQEMIIWSSLMWSVKTYDELKEQFYQKAHETCLPDGNDFDYFLARLKQVGIITYGKSETAIEALCLLTARLYVVPLNEKMWAKIVAFFHLTFKRRIPFSVTKKIFSKPKLTSEELALLALVRQALVTTEELVQCVDSKSTDISTEGKLMDALYPDGIPNPGTEYRVVSLNKIPITQTVVNLYLRKQVLFEPRNILCK